MIRPHYVIFFFFNDTATTEIYTLSLHDALPISLRSRRLPILTSELRLLRAANGSTLILLLSGARRHPTRTNCGSVSPAGKNRSEEHTSELQSQSNLVCRLLLEKKKNASLQLLIQ